MKVIGFSKKGSNVILSLENGESFKISYEAALKSSLKKGDVLTPEKLKKILLINDEIIIKNRALNLLGRRSHSTYELKLKLIKKFPAHKKIIDEIIKKLNNNGLLDDKKFALEIIESKTREGKTGITKLRAILISRGINATIINETLSLFQESHDFKQDALQVARKKYSLLLKRNLTSEKIKSRLFNFLKSKGFKADEILYSLRSLSLMD